MQTTNAISNASSPPPRTAGLYLRLSREDGDKTESLSITNQQLLLTEYAKKLSDISEWKYYIDDGYTGTNFNRPSFRQMINDIENGTIQCIIVKDLSRLGRNMPKVTEYVSEYFPSKKIRFIAIDDNIDKEYYSVDTSEDMMLEVKNMFNGFYPRDISKKVRSTFRSKQRDGQFIGAFASYGYQKSPANHNQLIIDEPAAAVVKRIYQMYLSGLGQLTIAKKLNDEGILCPSEYKKHCGLNYHNNNRMDSTHYWTYSTIRNILKNEIYIGTMVQNKDFRQVCKTKAIRLPKEQWIVVPDTHEAIIDKATWDKTQDLLKRNTRHMNLNQNIHIFAGFLKCGDCGRAMVKLKRNGTVIFHCGSYNRYGTNFCSSHAVKEAELAKIVLTDLNNIIASLKTLPSIIEKEQKKQQQDTLSHLGDPSVLQNELQKLLHKKERAYEDYSEDILSKEEYLKYKEKYEVQISALEKKINLINQTENASLLPSNKWIKRLLELGQIDKLDREIVVEMIDMIYLYENHTIKIIYNFSNDLDNCQ